MGTARRSPRGPLRRGPGGDGGTQLPRIDPALKSEAHPFKDDFKHLMSGSCESAADACFGFSSAVAAATFWFSLDCSRLCFSTSSSALARSAAELWSCSLWQNAHFLAATRFFSFQSFFGCSRSSWAQNAFIPISLFSYRWLPAS